MPNASPQVVLLAANDENRSVVARLLSARSLSVAATDDPRAAARLAAAAAELVIVDLALQAIEPVPRSSRRRDDPELKHPAAPDGYALLRSLARDPLLGYLPLVVLRTADDDATPQRFGVLDVVSKPVDGERLRAKVSRALLEETPSELTPAAPPQDGAAPLSFDVIPAAMRRALIVDPDARFRKWVRGLMAIHGFRVHEVEDAEHALATALAERPWLVLCEVDLPGQLNGLELCRQLRTHALTARLPFVLFSARDDYEDRYRGLEAGADDFVSKHVTARETLIRIQLVLKRYVKLGTRVGREGAAMGGRLELVGPAGVLQMCYLSGLSGILRVRNGSDTAEFGFRHGQIVSARSPQHEGAEAVYALMEWTDGHFEFVPGRAPEGPPLAERFDELLLEGCRRIDEQRYRVAGAAPS